MTDDGLFLTITGHTRERTHCLGGPVTVHADAPFAVPRELATGRAQVDLLE